MKKFKDFFLRNTSTRQTIAKNIFWLTWSQVLGRFVRALVIIYAARSLGATQYGIFSYALGLAAFFTIFADMGISLVMTREIARKPEVWQEYFATSFWLKIVLFLITGTMILIIAPFFSKIPEATALLPLIALLTIFDGIRELAFAFFRAKERMEVEALGNVVTNTIITVLGFLALVKMHTYSSFAFAYVVGSGLGTLFSISFLGRNFFHVVNKFTKSLIRPIIEAAWPMAFSAISGAFMLTIDIVILGWWRTPAEIGLYSAAQKIVQIFFTLPAILAGSTFPTFSRLLRTKEDGGKIQNLIEQATTLALGVGIPLLVGGVILGKPIILFLYGPDYLPAVLVLQIFAITFPMAFAGPLFSNLILAHDKQKVLVKYLIIGSVMNLVLDLILIPKFGIVGSAIGTLIVHTIYASATLFIAKKIQIFYMMRYLKRIILAAGAMGALSFALNFIGLPLIITIALSGIFYFVVLYLLRERLVSEIKIILDMMRGKK